MKQYILLITALLVITASLYSINGLSDHSGRMANIDPAIQPVKRALLQLEKSNSFQASNETERREKVSRILEDIPDSHQRLKRQYMVAMSALPKIEFHGRIIDQYNQPVKNASIYYDAENAYLSAGGGRGRARTDDEGYFVIDTNGAALQLGGVRHPHIDHVYHAKPEGLTNDLVPSRMPVTRFVSNGSDGDVQNYNNYASKDKAYIIHAWRLREYEGAISGNVIGGYDSDGKYYTLLLDQSVYNNRRKDGKTDGHLYVSCTRSHMEGVRDFGDWSVNITPVNGGIQETTDLYMNIAPESGYQPSLEIVMRKTSSDYLPYLRNKRYYFKSNNGKVYGNLLLRFEPFLDSSKEECRIEVHYTINPNGSRNLELKRDQSSQPQIPSPQKLASR